MQTFTNIIKNTKFLLVAALIALCSGVALAYANINSTYFKLAYLNGPMFMEVTADCPYNAKISITNLDTRSFLEEALYGGSLDGKWTYTTNMQPATRYRVNIYCYAQPNYAADTWSFDVRYYTNGNIQILRADY